MIAAMAPPRASGISAASSGSAACARADGARRAGGATAAVRCAPTAADGRRDQGRRSGGSGRGAGVRLDDEQCGVPPRSALVEVVRAQLHGGAGDVGAVGRAGVVDGALPVPDLDHEMAAGHGAVVELDVRPGPWSTGAASLCEGDPRAGGWAADGDQVDDGVGLGAAPPSPRRRRQQLDDVAVADVDLTDGRVRGPRPAARAGGAGADPEVAGERRDQLVDGRGLGAVDHEVVGASLRRRDGQAQPHSTS